MTSQERANLAAFAKREATRHQLADGVVIAAQNMVDGFGSLDMLKRLLRRYRVHVVGREDAS